MNKRLIKQLNSKGYMSLSEFMTFCLYDPDCGYYMTHTPIGADFDFITSPEISQLFGEIICIWAVTVWEKMGKPTSIRIIELGPGNGTLADDFIRSSMHFQDFAKACEFHLVEISEKLTKIQKDKLSKYKTKKEIYWHKHIPYSSQLPTIFIGNEFLDAIPTDQFALKNGIWYEMVITQKEESLAYSFVKTKNQFSNSFHDGFIIEKSETAEKILEDLSSYLKSFGGAALLIDYGYTEYPGHATLQAVRNHTYANPFSHIGDNDLTTHVNFKDLIKISSKYVNTHVTTQKDFLEMFGILQRAEILKKKSDPQKITSALSRLLDDMYPLFKVMILTKLC